MEKSAGMAMASYPAVGGPGNFSASTTVHPDVADIAQCADLTRKVN